MSFVTLHHPTRVGAGSAGVGRGARIPTQSVITCRLGCAPRPSMARGWNAPLLRPARQPVLMNAGKGFGNPKPTKKDEGTGKAGGGGSAPAKAEEGDEWYSKGGGEWQARTGEADTTVEEMSEKQVDERNDELIQVFLQRNRKDFRKLVVFSKEWPNLKDSFFARIRWAVDESGDPDERMELKQLLNTLEKVDAAIGRHNATIQLFRDAAPNTWEGMVGMRRRDLSPEFFEHLKCVVEAAHEDEKEQDELATFAANLQNIVSIHDKAIADQEAMANAAEVFQKDILGAGTLEEADKKIDELASQGKLDPALMLTMAKAWAGANESNMVEEEVKDIMHHLYMKSRETMGRQQPKEVRILKYLLTLEDPAELDAGLGEAFTPGPELEMWKDDGSEEDMLWCTPEDLLATIEAILKVYDASRGRPMGGMAGEAAALMQPAVIDRMRAVQMTVIQKYQ